MSLSEKALRLQLDAAAAGRVAAFWRKQVELHGERKATEFYTSLGLNHVEKKSVEWEGLTLSREPTEVEKLCVKSISSAQDAGKAQVLAVLLKAREELIAEAMKKIKKLKPADYHALLVDVPDELTSDLRAQLGKVFDKGRKLVAFELAKQKGKSYSEIAAESFVATTYGSSKQSGPTDDDDDELDDTADLTDSRVANEIQGRITSAATRLRLVGLIGNALWDAVEKEVSEGSTAWVEKIATGASNNVLSFGRTREMEDRKDEIERFEYSALLDSNVCEECAPFDGDTAASLDDLPDTPNPSCLGSDFCRCFAVAIAL